MLELNIFLFFLIKKYVEPPLKSMVDMVQRDQTYIKSNMYTIIFERASMSKILWVFEVIAYGYCVYDKLAMGKMYTDSLISRTFP